MVNAISGGVSPTNYADNINYSDASSYITKENGVTKEVFLRYAQAQFPDVALQEVEAIFNQIDRNGSGGLREREFDSWGVASTQSVAVQSSDSGASSSKGVASTGNSDAGVAQGNDFYDIPGGEGAQMNYVDLPSNTSKNIELNDADYIVIYSSSGGHGSNVTTGVNPQHFNIPDELSDRVVGWVGSRDACTIILDVRGMDSFPFEGHNECAYSLIRNVPEGMDLRLDNAASSNNTDGYIDPQKRKEEVLMSSSSDFMIYKEDEGTAATRIAKLESTAGVYFNKGEDNAVFVTNNDIKMQGNGAKALISFE